MIILGIDPGTTRVGFGVVQYDKSKLSPLAYGVIEPSFKDKALDMLYVHQEIQKIIVSHAPTCAGIEKLFFMKNKKTALAVSETKGSILLALGLAKIPVYEYTPLQVKQAVSSYGRADKDQVQKMVKLLLGIKDEIRPDDAADALAIAICCAHSIMGNKL